MSGTILAAADALWGIGRNGGLPWICPEDLARFRRRTMGRTVIVGMATFASLPSGLPGRRLVTVSSSGRGDYASVAEALEAEGGEAVVAGGSGVYREALAVCRAAEITRMAGTWGCDVFMPDLAAAGWELDRTDGEGTLSIERWSRR